MLMICQYTVSDVEIDIAISQTNHITLSENITDYQLREN